MIKALTTILLIFGAICIAALFKDFGCQEWHYEIRQIKGVFMDHRVCDFY